MKSLLKTVAACALVLGVPFAAAAQEKVVTSVKVQLVLTRYQGEKKVSSLPYTLVVNAGSVSTNGPRAQLRMGSQVPIPMIAGSPKDLPQGFQYRDVGISIDCAAGTLDDGRFRLDLNIDDSSVYGDDVPKREDPIATARVTGAPSFRQFRVTEQVVLKDGQSREFIAATDKVNGEVTKVEVTLTVVK